MLFDPRTSAKPSHAIAVEQRRLGERFFHAENVTGFYAPSNLEKPLVIKRFFHIRLRIHPQNSAMSQKIWPFCLRCVDRTSSHDFLSILLFSR